MDYFHGIAINAKKEVLTDMSSITNTIVSTTVNTVNSGNISGGSVSIPYFSYQSVQGKFNSKTTANTTADTTIQTSTTHTHIWTFQLKGQGKDLFRVILDDNFLILDGDDIAGYATRNGGYMDCSVTKNITRNISN